MESIFVLTLQDIVGGVLLGIICSVLLGIFIIDTVKGWLK